MAMSAVYTNFGGMLVFETRGGTERQYVSDPLGSLAGELDSTQATTYTAEYWPYGEIQTESGTNTSNWSFVGLLGYLKDLASLLYVRARHYLTPKARWLTVDPLWPSELAYEYASSTPLVAKDPSGLGIPFWILALALAAYGLICVACILSTLQALEDIPLATQDKRKHCVMACMLTMKCGTACGLAFALGTEIADLICKYVFKKDCHPTMDDVWANATGVTCGLFHSVTSCFPWIWIDPRNYCEDCCRKANYGQGFGARGFVVR